jgi:cellulose synthase/poly-beta-1,6-N-acetylglucosamine synthase-like glycosyltransferase
MSVSVIICAYTEDRWALLAKAVESVQKQSRPPLEILICIDHNEALFSRARKFWFGAHDDPDLPISIIANKYAGHLGSARNTAAELARGDILAFLDDDAAADDDWLETLLPVYDDDAVVAVGGAPHPVYETRRPHWFPFEFDWVFGCTYRGLPETRGPLAHLIGANMSVRRHALAEIGGFHSDDHDDMDMCHRLAHHRPNDQLLFEPNAIVRHFVRAERVTWRYFWRRCFWVNRSKVTALQQMEGAANLSAERAFVLRAISRGTRDGLRDALRGDLWGIVRAISIIIGVTLAAAGHIVGRVQLLVRRSGRSGP